MKIKKIIALLLTMAIGASIFAGCSKTYEKVTTIDGEPISPSIYLMAQLEGYFNAAQKIEAGEDLLKSTIEEKTAKQWIYDETIKTLQAYVFANREFEKRGLAFTVDEASQMDANSEYMWATVEAMYTPNGIGYETYKQMLTTVYKRDKIFYDIYGPEGEKAPTDDEAKKYIEETYSRVNGLYISKVDDAGTAVSEDKIKELSAVANDALADLKGGADFVQTQVKYMTIAGTITGSTNDFSKAEDYTWNTNVKKDSTQYPAAFIKDTFAAEVNGDYAVYEMDQEFVVYQRVENYKDETEFKTMKANVVAEMKNDEFLAFVKEQSSAYEVKPDDAAVKYYSLEKVKY